MTEGTTPPPSGGEMHPLPPTPTSTPITRARLEDKDVLAVANSANRLFQEKDLLEEEGLAELQRHRTTLEDVLQGKVLTPAGAKISEGTLATIRGLPVVQNIEGTLSAWATQMRVCGTYFDDSTYMNKALTKTDNPEKPSLGDYLVGTRSKAVVQERSKAGHPVAHVDDKHALKIELTPLRDQRAFRVAVTVPKGKESHFGGVTSFEQEYATFAEAQRAIDGVLDRARARPARDSLALAQKLQNVSTTVIAKQWVSKFPCGCPTMTEEDAIGCVIASDLRGATRYKPWKTDDTPPEYYLAVHKAGELPKKYRVRFTPCPAYLWNRHPRIVVLTGLEGGKEEPLSLGNLEKQEERLGQIFKTPLLSLVKYL
jgi:hypothetical protein